MSSVKLEFDSSFEKLLDRLKGLTGEILVKALGDNPQKKDHDHLNGYWLELQLEIAQKIKKLTDFQNELNVRCHSVVMKTDYTDLTGPAPHRGHHITYPLPEATDMP